MINNCENCGGEIIFDPKNKGNVCQNCGSVFPIKYNKKFVKKAFDESSNLKNFSLKNQIKNVKCGDCGASIIFNKNEVKSECPYCGNKQITEENLQNLMYIDTIVPFVFDKNQALSIFKTKVNKNFYANKKLLQNLTEKNINGTYINAFVFDLNTSISYSGVFSYSSREKDKDGNVKYVTRYRNVRGIFDKNYQNITVEANSNIEQSELSQILPYNYGDAVDFDPNFINGYMIEYHDKMFEECAKTAENIIKEDAQFELLRKYNCDKIERISMDIKYHDKKYNYCLLPVYFINKKIKNKNYKILMNGQTGATNSLPKNWFKILLTVLGCLFIVVAIVLAIIFNT